MHLKGYSWCCSNGDAHYYLIAILMKQVKEMCALSETDDNKLDDWSNYYLKKKNINSMQHRLTSWSDRSSLNMLSAHTSNVIISRMKPKEYVCTDTHKHIS